MQMPLTQSLLVVFGVLGLSCVTYDHGWHYMAGNLPVGLRWSLLVLLEINMYLGTLY